MFDSFLKEVNKHNEIIKKSFDEIDDTLDYIFNDRNNVAYVLTQRDMLYISIYSTTGYIKKYMELSIFISLLKKSDIRNVNLKNIDTIKTLIDDYYKDKILGKK